MNLEGQAHGEVDLSTALDDTMGLFSPPKEDETHGVVNIEPTLICLNDDIIPIPCEDESHIAHLSEIKSEMSDSTICEIECSHFEGMSDTPSVMRVVVDRSCEAISISNNLPSTLSVSPHVAIGSMDEEMPILGKMYMVHTHDVISQD
jgi:hypothetical protein